MQKVPQPSKNANALQLAEYTEKLNRQRQKITAQDMKIVKPIVKQPQNQKANTLVIYDPRLHPQVVGIEASRVIEMTYKPTIVIGHLPGDPKNINRGSGRSIPEFDLFKAMNPIRKDMTSFGGHPMACGLSIKTDSINKLRRDLEKQARDLGHVQPTVAPDLLITPRQVTMQLMNQLNQLQPYGEANEEPLVALEVPQVYQVQQMGKNKNTLGFRLGNNFKATKVVGFKMGKYATFFQKQPQHWILIGNLSLNHYKGYTNVQFMLQHAQHYYQPLSRKQVAIVYKELYYLTHIQPQTNYQNVVKFTRDYLTQRNLNLSLQVLAELKLIYQDQNNYYHLVQHPKRQSLKNSKTFQEHC